jgi:hypothetical protein
VRKAIKESGYDTRSFLTLYGDYGTGTLTDVAPCPGRNEIFSDNYIDGTSANVHEVSWVEYNGSNNESIYTTKYVELYTRLALQIQCGEYTSQENTECKRLGTDIPQPRPKRCK